MKLGLLLALLALTGCATIVNGTHEELAIVSDPPDATFSIQDDGGRVVASGQTPATVNVSRSSGFFQPARYQLHVSKPGYLPTSTAISSRTDILWWIDWLLLVPGILIDPFTGAMWDLQNPPPQRLYVDVPFTPAR